METKKSRFVVYELAHTAAVHVHTLLETARPRHKALVDQAQRAVFSVPLNIEEGAGRFGKDRTYHFRVAYASSRETSAALRLLRDTRALKRSEAQAALDRLDRVQGMLWRLAGR